MISPALKLKLETALMVFLASFLTSVGSQLTSLSFSGLSWSIVGSIVTSAIGVAVQAIYNAFIQSSLGNQLKGVKIL